jgi:hypothetical protein
MRRLAAVTTLLLPVLLTPPACDTCGAPERCLYATLLLFVHDVETGDPLPDATVTQSGSPIGTDLTSVTCAGGPCTHAVSPGTGTVTISLPGYQDAFINFTARHDSCGAATRQFFDVGMRALSEPTATPVVTGPDAGTSGCQ